MKPIGVLTNNISSTFEWLKNNHGVNKVQHNSRIGTNTQTGREYLLILNREDALGWELSDMLISPFYESLEQLVRSRIR